MAHLDQRRTENIAGNFYVDHTCIDCDTCRWMAPHIFQRQAEKSAVYYQPNNQQEKIIAMQALLSCPTSSIGTVEKPTDIKDVQQTFPLLVSDHIYHCGYHSVKSYGAASYLIIRPAGNILVDSPRYAPPLVKQIENMGGVRYLYLTHRDDVADHKQWHEHFQCDRLLHIDEITEDTQDVEIKLTGQDVIHFADDLSIIPVPGHTLGHTVLLHQDFLFTGDHLAWSAHLQNLAAFRQHCWYSWSEQITSMKKLTNYKFQWVLPGHGRRYYADEATMQTQLNQCISWMTEVL